MGVVAVIQSAVSKQLQALFQLDIKPSDILVNETKPEFEGDYTVVLFALAKTLKGRPAEEVGAALGNALLESGKEIFQNTMSSRDS